MRDRGAKASSLGTGSPAALGDLPFAVVDVETTGFSPRVGDRIVEIAILRIDKSGAIKDEWVTLVNPLRDVGPTHVHGITQEDVASAPTFEEILGDVVGRLDHAVFVAHNDAFDREFIAAELSMAGVFLPVMPSVCTLKLACRLYPGLTNHQLSRCCEAAGLAVDGQHSALDDARAAGRLLLVLLQVGEAAGLTNLRSLGCSCESFPDGWPSFPPSGRLCGRTGRASPDLPYLARIVASLGSVEIGNERIGPYLDLLDRALDDRLVSEEESEALRATAVAWGLSREDVMAAHHSYLEALVVAALADGRVTELERRDLWGVARLLAIDTGMLNAMVSKARHARDRGPALRSETQ